MKEKFERIGISKSKGRIYSLKSRKFAINFSVSFIVKEF